MLSLPCRMQRACLSNFNRLAVWAVSTGLRRHPSEQLSRRWVSGYHDYNDLHIALASAAVVIDSDVASAFRFREDRNISPMHHS